MHPTIKSQKMTRYAIKYGQPSYLQINELINLSSAINKKQTQLLQSRATKKRGTPLGTNNFKNLNPCNRKPKNKQKNI